MDLLAFARGPGLVVSIAILAVGIAWRLYAIFARPAPVDYSEARSTATISGALRAIVSRMWPYRPFAQRSLAVTINAYAYHVGLAVVVLGFAPHIAFIERYSGVAWPAVPRWVFVLAVGLVFLGMITALVARFRSPVLRLLSTFDDYASWTIVMLPMVTGMALVTSFESRAPAPLDPGPVAIHLLTLELLLVWLPFSKLSHAFLVFVSRGVTGARFVRRGAAL